MTVANILTIGSGEYEELSFVLFPHLMTVPARTFFLSTYGRSYSYPLIRAGEGQNFGLSYTRLMTMDLLQYDIAVTEIHHTTCSKHVVVDGKGLVSMQPSHVYFWMCTKHRF